jgi:hypothetical protein
MQLSLHSPKSVQTWNQIKSNWIIQTVHKCIIFLTVLSLGLIAWRWRTMPPLIPLWYSKPWGSDQLANPFFIFILPLGCLTLYGINTLISIYVTAEYLVFTQILFLTSLLINFLAFITLIKILFLVT